MLTNMDDKLQESYGYSPELLRGGVKNWPWRLTPEMAAENNVGGKIKGLGVVKTDIEMAESYGQSQNDPLTDKLEIA